MDYKICVDKSTGSVLMYSNSDLPDMGDSNLITMDVPEKFNGIFERIRVGKESLSSIRVVVDSKEFKIYSLDDLQDSDPDYGKWFQLTGYRRNFPENADVMLKIFSKNFKPYLSIKFVGDPEILKDPKRHSLDFYFTKKNDINCLYESFHTNFDKLDKNKEIVFPLERIDTDKLFQNDFSVFYRKIFKTVYYIIE